MVDHTLTSLVELAKDKSAQARRRLMENITDLFISDDGRLSEHERALMQDILGKLIGSVETDLRRELSESLVKTGIDLPELARMLANDEIEIARPLLEESKLLRNEDLVDIVRMRTDEHRISIAVREEVSEDVADALVEYGNEDVIETLLRNADAAISERAMAYVVAESRRVDRFQEPLVLREDLPPELAYRMYWWVSAALRKQIVTEFEVDPSVLDQALHRAAKNVLVDQQKGGGVYVQAQRLVRRMAETGDLTVQFLVNSLRQRKIAVFVAGLAELGNVDFRTAWRIFSDSGGESLAILARAIGIDRNQFTSIFLLIAQAREGQSVRSPSVLKRILELFDSVTVENARGALQYWQRDSAYQIAVEELENVG